MDDFVAIHPNAYDEILRRSGTTEIRKIMGLEVITSSYVPENEAYIKTSGPPEVASIDWFYSIAENIIYAKVDKEEEEPEPCYQESHLDLSDFFMEA